MTREDIEALFEYSPLLTKFLKLHELYDVFIEYMLTQGLHSERNKGALKAHADHNGLIPHLISPENTTEGEDFWEDKKFEFIAYKEKSEKLQRKLNYIWL